MLCGIWPDRISGLGDIGDGSAGVEEVENRLILTKVSFHVSFSTLNPISAISKVLESSFVEKWEKMGENCGARFVICATRRHQATTTH